jgi:RNA polymerase sigma-70 factor (ECF subfamily)
MVAQEVPLETVHDSVSWESPLEERKMADIVRKQVVSVEGATVRERLQAMDDSAVVTAFLGGEERAFSELVTRYQTRLLNFVYRTIGDRE